MSNTRPWGSGAVLVGGIAVGMAMYEAWILLVLFVVTTIIIWIALVKKTCCDVETKNRTGGCENNANGALRACHLKAHKRIKQDALFAIFGLTNPAQRYRVLWARSNLTYGRTTPAPTAANPRITRPLYDATMLVATVLGSFGTLAALAFQLI